MHPMSLWESGDSSGLVSLADVCAGHDIGVQNGAVTLDVKIDELLPLVPGKVAAGK